MKKRNNIIAVLMLSFFMTFGVFTYITNANQKREAAIKAEAEAKAKAEADIKKALQAQEVKAVESQPKPVEAPKKVEVKKTPSKPTVKTASVSRTSTVSRGTKTASKPVSKPKSGISDADRDLFYRLVSAEAAGESFEGKLAIATIIMNRVKSPNYPNTIRGVIYDKNWGYQFTPVLDGRINLPATGDSKRAVDKVLSGYRSFDSRVLYFMNPEKSTNMWIIENKTYYKTIGNHKFYY